MLELQPAHAPETSPEATDYGEMHRSGDLSVGIFEIPAGGDDGQAPHAEDEVYVVLAGRARRPACPCVEHGRPPISHGVPGRTALGRESLPAGEPLRR